MTKLCKDCRHSIQDDKPMWWVCRLTRTVSLVDGRESHTLCAITRVTLAQCGPDAVWFSPRPDLVDAEPPDQYNREESDHA